MKCSHVEEEVIDKFGLFIKDEFVDEEIGKLKIVKGDEHDYLAMLFDYSTPGEVKISMKGHVEEIINKFPNPELIKGNPATPASDHLFKVNEKAKKNYLNI